MAGGVWLKSAVILNGGKSSRLSVKNKAVLKIRGVPIIKHICSTLEPIFDEIIIISNSPDDIEEILPGKAIFRDEVESLGPLSGIYTGLLKIKSDRAFFCACDMPFLNPELIKNVMRKSLKHDITCPVFEGRIESLHSVYSRKCIGLIEELFKAGEFYKVSYLFSMGKTRLVSMDKAPCDVHIYDFLNINTWKDYNLASCIAKQI
jgi:molybdopterin-guanine dinucleotide biosynthesis protein A